MAKVYQKFIAMVLVLLLGAGAVSDAASVVASCLPKACCCKAANPSMMDHIEQMEMNPKCTPETPAPCCRVEPLRPKTDLAVSSPPDNALHRLKLVHMTGSHSVEKPQQLHSIFKSFLDDGKPKIPLVPIYLQTLTLLI